MPDVLLPLETLPPEECAPVASEGPGLPEGATWQAVIDPTALSRAASLAHIFGVECGRTAEEQELVTLVPRAADLLVVADYDRATTATVDGRRRPMHFRCRVPVRQALTADPHPVTVRSGDLVKLLRNKQENSELYGVLAQPAELTLFPANHPGSRGRLALRPSTGGSQQVRGIEATDGPAIVDLIDLELEQAEASVGALDGNTLIEASGLATEEIGVLLDPIGSKSNASLTAVSARGVMVTTFPSAQGNQNQADLFGTEQMASPPGRRVLTEPAVLSARFAFACGLSTNAMTEVARARQRIAAAQHHARLLAAALAAALDLDGSEPGARLGTLYAALGQAVAEKLANVVTGHGESAIDAALRAAHALVDRLGPVGAVAASNGVLRALDPAGQRVRAVLREQLREAAGDDAALARAAEAYLAGLSEPARLREALAVAAGEAITHAALHEMFVDSGEPDPVVHRSDLALAAVRAGSRRAGELVDTVLREVEPDHRAAWWAGFEAYARQLGVPASALEDALGLREVGEGLPTAKSLKIPDARRSEWLQAAQRSMQGTLWRRTDGRCVATWCDADAGDIMVSDLPVQPDPAAYPIALDAVREMLRDRAALPFQARLYASDLEWAARQVVGLMHVDRLVGRPAPGQREGPLFVGRWTPGDSPERPDGAVLDHVRNPVHRVLLTPETVWVGQGDDLALKTLPRPQTMIPVEPAAVAGTLRVFGFEPWGEVCHLHLPIKALQTAGQTAPLALALNAEGLQDLIDFASGDGRECLLEVGPHTLRMADLNRSRVVMLPTIGARQVPVRLQALVAAAGVADAVPETPLTRIVARAKALRMPGDVPRSPAAARTLESPVAASVGSIEPLVLTSHVSARARKQKTYTSIGMFVSRIRDLVEWDRAQRHWAAEEARYATLVTYLPTPKILRDQVRTDATDPRHRAAAIKAAFHALLARHPIVRDALARDVSLRDKVAALNAILVPHDHGIANFPLPRALDLFAGTDDALQGTVEAMIEAWHVITERIGQLRRDAVKAVKEYRANRAIQAPLATGPIHGRMQKAALLTDEAAAQAVAEIDEVVQPVANEPARRHSRRS